MQHSSVEKLIVVCEKLSTELTLENFDELEPKIKAVTLTIQNISWGQKTEAKNDLLKRLISATQKLVSRYEFLKNEANQVQSNNVTQKAKIKAFYEQA